MAQPVASKPALTALHENPAGQPALNPPGAAHTSRYVAWGPGTLLHRASGAQKIELPPPAVTKQHTLSVRQSLSSSHVTRVAPGLTIAVGTQSAVGEYVSVMMKGALGPVRRLQQTLSSPTLRPATPLQVTVGSTHAPAPSQIVKSEFAVSQGVPRSKREKLQSLWFLHCPLPRHRLEVILPLEIWQSFDWQITGEQA